MLLSEPLAKCCRFCEICLKVCFDFLYPPPSFTTAKKSQEGEVYKKGVLTFSQTIPVFHVYGRSLLKTLWQKEKWLVTSHFSFSHSVFYQFEELSSIFIKFEIVCKLFLFGRV